jgi:hypothetical protein
LPPQAQGQGQVGQGVQAAEGAAVTGQALVVWELSRPGALLAGAALAAAAAPQAGGVNSSSSLRLRWQAVCGTGMR